MVLDGTRLSQRRRYYGVEKAAEAFNKTLEVLEPENIWYANAIAALKVYDYYAKCSDPKSAFVHATSYDLRKHGGSQYLYSQPGFTINNQGFFTDILYYATEGLDILDRTANVGETVCEHDHSAKLISDTETVETPAGTFENCELWKKEGQLFYIKPGVGIVKGISEGQYNRGTVLLSEYEIKSGNGKMPFDTGNRWVYVSDNPEYVELYEDYVVIYSKGDERAALASYAHAVRIKYNENSWEDMMLKLYDDYFVYVELADEKGDYSKHNIIFDDLSRLNEIADTPYKKLFAEKASGVMRRLIESNPNFLPDCKEVGIWNFFNAERIGIKDGVSRMTEKFYRFEWKWWYGAAYMLLHNFMIEELNNCGALWDDEWKPGYSAEKEHRDYHSNTKSVVNCSEGGTVTTAAGTFENCLKVTIEYSGYPEGRNYMSGKKEYYFAEGIGIVKHIHHIGWAVYELTSYDGTGEGYMPLSDGISRHYKGVNFPYGMRGEVDFICITDDNGELVMIIDQLGMQNRED